MREASTNNKGVGCPHLEEGGGVNSYVFFHKPGIASARKEMADEGHQGGCEVGQGDGKEDQLDQLEVMRLVPVAHSLHHLPVQLIPVTHFGIKLEY